MTNYRLTTNKSWSATLDDLAETFRKWGVLIWSVTPTNPGRKAQNRYQSVGERTVVLTYKAGGRDVRLEMSTQDRAVDNLRVLYLVMEALRLNESRGLAASVAEAYRQTYPALPAPGQQTPAATSSPYQVLYVVPDAPLAVCEAAYRVLAKTAHPDAGGSAAEMARLTAAIEAIRRQGG
jgi:hypothetical protein